MGRTREVTLRLRLPTLLADRAEEVQRDDPEFLERIVFYGLTRREVHRHILERDAEKGET